MDGLRRHFKGKSKFTIALYLFVRATMIVVFAVSLLKQEYLTASQAVLTLILFAIPELIDRKLHIEIPNLLEIIILLFIYASVFLGEMQDYYYKFPYWDTMLHGCSMFVIAGIGFSLINILNKSKKITMQLSPFFVSFFSVCFATFVAVVWEIYEYFMDMAFGFDMQKDTILANGAVDIGLIDTMEDLIIGLIGALIFAVIGYFYVKSKGKSMQLVDNILMQPKITDDEYTLEPPASEPKAPDPESKKQPGPKKK